MTNTFLLINLIKKVIKFKRKNYERFKKVIKSHKTGHGKRFYHEQVKESVKKNNNKVMKSTYRKVVKK